MTQQHVMIDLETWGRAANATIISIGAVKFDPLDRDAPMDNFYVCVDPRASHASFRELFDIDPDTVMWWMDAKQTEAREHWLSATKFDLATVLSGFLEWYGPESLPTWGNGATFDNVILLRSIELAGMARPWHFGHDRCYRTLKTLCPKVKLPPMRDVGPIDGPHTALFDARWQALHTQLLFEELGLAPAVPEPVDQGKQHGSSIDGSPVDGHDAISMAVGLWGDPAKVRVHEVDAPARAEDDGPLPTASEMGLGDEG